MKTFLVSIHQHIQKQQNILPPSRRTLNNKLWLRTFNISNKEDRSDSNHLCSDKITMRLCFLKKNKRKICLVLERNANRYGSKIVIQKALGEPNATPV